MLHAKLWLFTLALLLSSCAGSGRSEKSAVAEAQARSTFLEYKACMYGAAESYASSQATPSEVAEAAHSKCGGVFYRYQRAVEDYFISAVSRSGVRMAQREAAEKTQDTMAMLKGEVVRLVVEQRTKKPEPPRPSITSRSESI